MGLCVNKIIGGVKMKSNKKVKVLSIGVLLVLTLSSIVGCSSNNVEESYSDVDSTKTINLVEENEKTLVIDVRSSDAYAKGHLANAINIPFDEFEDKINDLDGYKDQTVIQGTKVVKQLKCYQTKVLLRYIMQKMEWMNLTIKQLSTTI